MTFTLSAGNPVWSIDPTPDFQGFLVVMCEFQFAHGYAFTTDGAAGIPTLAQGYLALVLQYQHPEYDSDRLVDCWSYYSSKSHNSCRSEGSNH